MLSNVLRALLHLSIAACWCISPHFIDEKNRKLRLREVKWLVQDHPASKWSAWLKAGAFILHGGAPGAGWIYLTIQEAKVPDVSAVGYLKWKVKSLQDFRTFWLAKNIALFFKNLENGTVDCFQYKVFQKIITVSLCQWENSLKVI